MALDEFIFGKLSNHYRKKKKRAEEIAKRSIPLESLKEKLTVLARAASGTAIDLYPAEREGGYKNNAFFLPVSVALFETQDWNQRFYVYRTLYLAVQKKLDYNWQSQDKNTIDLSRAKAMECSSMILTQLFHEYPALEDWHKHFYECSPKNERTEELDTTWLYGKWMVNRPEELEKEELKNFSEKTKRAEEEKELTTLKVKAVEEIISLEVDKKQQEDYVLTHNFEKVDTAEEFDGVWRDFDGDDDLKKHENALDELNMKFTVRVDDTTHSVYQADFIENASVSESTEIDSEEYHLSYDEWNYSKNQYKENFCKVYPKAVQGTDHAYYKSTLATYATTLVGLRKMLANINNKRRQQLRQPQGSEFDTDALTDLFVDVHSKHTPSENIYIANRKLEKDLSILILLDISLSSDGYVDGNRIIDVEKQVSILFGEILNENGVDFAISGFYSKTRNYSNYVTIKGFDDNWNRSKNTIGALVPDGYTRIGPAIRHSATLLEKRETQNKWVVLLSDGKPNDFDRYEGKYGINDVKQALRELQEKRINAYALAIEEKAKYYLPQMFGQNHYQILSSPVELLSSMVQFYQKIKG